MPPYTPVKVNWKRPPIDHEVLKQCTHRSDLQGLWHCLGVLAILTISGAVAYYFYATQRWIWMAVR